jgi:hypothetical protein
MVDTVKTYLDRIVNLDSEFTYLQKSIQNSFSKKSTFDLSQHAEIQNLIEQEQTFDRKFNDAEAELSAFGGKTRQQTLQEFVLLFFYISYAVIAVAGCLFVYTTTQNIKETLKLAGLFLLIAFVSVGILIKYV